MNEVFHLDYTPSMPLVFTYADHLDLLQAKLANILHDSPPLSPFEAETIVVADPAMARWLSLRLAKALGINCNCHYVQPVAWLRSMMQEDMPHTAKYDPLSDQRMSWLIFSLLPSLLNNPAFMPLATYLIDDEHGVKRWQLACRIAHVFDRYQDNRPAWIRAWSAGEVGHWQACLWRALLTVVGRNNYRVAWMDAWLTHINDNNTKASSTLRVCLFGMAALPPLWLKILQARSTHRDVFIFQWHTPVSPHPLSQAWGHADLPNTGQDHVYLGRDEPWPKTLLGQLQRAISRQSSPKIDVDAVDNTLQLHSCHTPMREVEVWHDALLSMLDIDPSLQAEDILVLVPEISRYAPYIEVVFSRQDARPFIPWNISDVYVADEHPVIEIFFQLLQLPESRFTQSEITAYLDVEEITHHFALDEEQLQIIRGMLAELHVRWGVDAAHRASFDLPAWQEQSWQAAADRLFAGYALGSDQDWEGIAPVPVDTKTATAMASFFALFEVLNDWREALNTSQTAVQWQVALSQMMNAIFGEAEATQTKLDAIYCAIDGLARGADSALLHISVVYQCLKEALQSSLQYGRYFSGGVSFCAMRPMRPLPFRVIALLGMHDAAFPRRDVSYEFDCMAAMPQTGDPNHGVEDRYTMLQTVLSAKDTLYISYCGRSIKNNTPCQPSVLVGELLDVLDQNKGCANISQHITTQHPMQPFSAQNYVGHFSSYDRHWASINGQMKHHTDASAIKHWPKCRLDGQAFGDNQVHLSALMRFACDPVTFFFNQRMGIRLQDCKQYADDEIFTLDHLQTWQVRQRMLDEAIAGETLDAGLLASQGLLPHGAFAVQQLNQEAAVIHGLQQDLRPYLQTATAPQRIVLSFGKTDDETIILTGQPTGYYPKKGLMHYTASSYKAKPALRLWLEHLALCAANRYPSGEQSTLLCRDAHKIIAVIPQEEACHILHGFVVAMQEGFHRPLPVFAKSSWAWANVMHKNKGDIAALNGAKKAWHTADYHTGDEEDPYIQLAMRGVQGAPIASPEFAIWAEQWYAPLLQYMVDA